MLIQMTSTKLPVELVFIQLIFNICTSTPKHKRLWCVKLAMFNFKNTLESCKIHERWKESTKIQKPDTLKSLQDEESLSWSVPPLYPKDFIEQFSESCYYNTKSIWIMKLWMKTLWMWTPFILSSWMAKQKKEKKKKAKDGRDVSLVEEEVLDTVRDKEARGPVQTTLSETSTNT